MKLRLLVVAMLAFFGAPAFAEEVHPLFSKGVTTYKQFCSHCHGLKMVNAGTTTYDLRKYPTDQPASFFGTVRGGKGDMPAWGDILFPEEMEAVWVYVSTRAGKQPFPEEAAFLPEYANPDVAEGAEKEAENAESTDG